MATDFTKEQYAGVYKSFYYGIDSILAGSAANPIHIFDVSKQNEQLTGVVDLTVRMEFIAMYPRICKPMPSLSVIECSNLKAMDQR